MRQIPVLKVILVQEVHKVSRVMLGQQVPKVTPAQEAHKVRRVLLVTKVT